jgi:hypothetical protein
MVLGAALNPAPVPGLAQLRRLSIAQLSRLEVTRADAGPARAPCAQGANCRSKRHHHRHNKD